MSRLDFAIIGAQKAGTTALAQFLGQHPDIAMSQPKETHLFDAEDFEPGNSPEHISHALSAFFDGATEAQLHGEATPVYLYWPDALKSLQAYRPDMKIIVLLRDPVDRAISHYEMEKQRGNESQTLFRALMMEPRRLRNDPKPGEIPSATRLHSYRDRGYYSRQLSRVFQLFPQDQVLILHMQDLLTKHDEVLAKVFRFLCVDESIRVPHELVFSGAATATPRHWLSRIILKTTYLLEYWRIRKYVDFPITSWIW